MTARFANRLARTILLASAVLVAGGCAVGSKPTVRDFDSYEEVTIGPVHYVTPQGTRVLEQGAGYVDHSIAAVPGGVFTVEVDPSPPRSLRDDADQKKRRFLRSIPNGRLTSVQYHEVGERRYVRVFAKGTTEGGKELTGVMTYLREKKSAAVVKSVGPLEYQNELRHATEDLAGRVKL